MGRVMDELARYLGTLGKLDSLNCNSDYAGDMGDCFSAGHPRARVWESVAFVAQLAEPRNYWASLKLNFTKSGSGTVLAS